MRIAFRWVFLLALLPWLAACAGAADTASPAVDIPAGEPAFVLFYTDN